jgi:hypothetical protein
MLDKLSSTSFSQYINQKFTLHLEGSEPLELELIEVAKLGNPPKDPQQRHAFSILFSGPNQPVLPQQIYRLEHRAMGMLDIFLVPLGPDGTGGLGYEAVFT